MRPVAEPDKQKRALVVMPDQPSQRDKLLARSTEESLRLVPHARESFAERQDRLEGNRVKYAGMIAHQEMAASVLAAGGNFKLAAAKAGVSVRQVKKYYTENDFRARIEELRTIMFQKVRGRVIKEMEKRTRDGKIDQIELLDLLRIFDRVYGGPGAGAKGINIAGDLNVGGNHYDNIIAALLAAKPGEESTDFPVFEPSEFSSPDSGSPE